MSKRSTSVAPVELIQRDHECPMCRRRFQSTAMGCHRGCPVASHCGALCCPHCGYEFVDSSRVEARFRKLGAIWRTALSWVRPKLPSTPAGKTPTEERNRPR